jgi:hypothetical protein
MMLAAKREARRSLQSLAIKGQPTTDLLTLVVHVQRAMARFEHVVSQMTEGVDGIAVQLRGGPKQLGRIIEKALLKGPRAPGR